MTYPIGWKAFCEWHKSHGRDSLPPNIDLAELNRFAARYRLAKSFRSLEVDGYAKSTVDAYGSLMKAFLAYSALEQLHKATRGQSEEHLNNRWAKWAQESSVLLRQSPEILEFLHQQMHSKRLQRNLQEFIDGKSENTLHVATSLRHAVAHGFMSVHPNGSSAKAAVIFCEQITIMLVNIMDREFSHLVASLT